MATKKQKKQEFPVREPNADDAIELLGILGAAGVDGEVGDAIGLAIRAFRSTEDGAQDVMIQAASRAITTGLSGALRSREARVDARNFIYRIWQPKLSVGENETYEQAKAKAWDALPMRAPIEIVESFRKTDNFSDFLAFFRDMLPTPTTSSDSSTASSEDTASDEAAS